MSKFKVGDRVRFKNDCYDYGGDDTCASKGDHGSVVAVDDEDITIKLDAPSYITTEPSNLDIVEPTDRKTAFLAELKELLIRHNAMIEITEDFPDCAYIKFHVGEESISFEDIGLTEIGGDRLEVITPDNIMGYDKEGV